MFRVDPTGGASNSLPTAADAATYVLSAMMQDARAVHEVMPILRVEDFFADRDQIVCAAIYELAAEGKPFDAVAVNDALTPANRESIGGIEWLGELVDCAPHTCNAVYSAQIVKQHALARKVYEEANDLARAVLSRQHTSAELVAMAQSRFMALGEQQSDTELTLRQSVDRALSTLDRRWQGEDPGVRLPWPKLDRMLDGFRPGRFYLIAARPSQGKSAMLFQALEHAAMTVYGGGVPAMLFTLEMMAEELAERYLSSRSDVNSYAFRLPHQMLDGAKLDRLYVARDGSNDSRLWIDEAEGLTVDQIAARARRRKHKTGLAIVGVDYLQLIDSHAAKGENRQEAVAKISRGLRRLAKELRIPVVAASQLNRAVESRPASENRPRLSDLRESGQLEQDAHAVLLLHRDDQSGLTEVIVAKNRGGSTGVVPLVFRGEFTRFEDVPDPVNPPPIDTTDF